MIVIDASTVLSWIFENKAAPEPQAALTYITANGAIVPGNFQSEVAHALLNALRRGVIAQPDLSTALAELFALPIGTDFPDPHVIVALGLKHRLTGSDAAYLALAVQSQLPLATVDNTLRKAATAEGLLWAV